MKTISLNGTWSLSGKPQNSSSTQLLRLCATVPGCVQLDLSEAGYLPQDLYMGKNILETEKYELYEWWYERSFDAPQERDNVFLVFEGVDCVAEYFLNGEKLGESENMLIAHEFDISRYLKDGENLLTVHIKSPIIAAHEAEYTVQSLMGWGDPTETALRRAPHTYGWDIMPRAVTSGLWRQVRIEIRDEAYFSQLYFCPTADSCTVFYELNCHIELLPHLSVEAEGVCGDSRFYMHREPYYRGKLDKCVLNIDDPKPWMPYGYGEANVYRGEARILKDGEVIHREPVSFGLRTVELQRTDTTDGKSGCFRFLINGKEIMCKGSNWVPMDAFHSRDEGRYEAALELVKDIGCNILRCWGGNVYEDHTFFDFCDENGIMVWQDFSMACRQYPQDERFKRLITEEATAVVRKLRNHPSLILWAGDNEIDEACMFQGLDPTANRITREWLPEVCRLNDLSRPFLPSSPYVASASITDAEILPEDHRWGPRDYFKSDFYRNNKAHFVSETGYHGCPSLDSIKKFITPEKVWSYRNNSEWNFHSTDQHDSDFRVMLMHKQVAQLFGRVPTDPEAYIFASQASQAEAKKYFIERMRVDRPNKTGIIWWNLIDGWPQMSDAVVDYYYEKKLAYGYIKRSQAPFAVIADELTNWCLPIYACNDTLSEIKGHLTVSDADTDELLYETDFCAAANTSTLLTRLPLLYSAQKMLIFRWETEKESGFNHYLCGYPAFDLEKYRALVKKHGLEV